MDHFELELSTEPDSWRASLLLHILRIGLGLGAIVYAPSAYLSLRSGFYGLAIVDTLALVLIGCLLFLRPIPFRWRALVFCLICYSLGFALLLTVGSVSQIYLFGFSILTTLLLGLRAGLLASALSTITMLWVGYTGRLPGEMAIPASWNFPAWAIITLNFTLVSMMLTFAIGVVLSAIERALSREIATRTALETERTLLRTLIDTLPDVVITKDRRGQFQSGNAAALLLMKMDSEAEMIGKTVFDVYPPEQAEIRHLDDLQVLQGNQVVNREEQVSDAEGEPVWVLTIKAPLRDPDGGITGLIAISRNITDRMLLEQQLRQSQKMEAVGQLAGGVAHDFNNMLTVINGYSHLLLRSMPTDDPNRGKVEEILRAGERSAGLTRQLLAFSRRQVLAPRIINLNAIVRDVREMLQRLIGEDVALTAVLDRDLALVKADPGQIEQVLMNLAVNARDAMPKGGKLTIETLNVELGDAYARTHVDVESKSYVMLAVTDTGTGMTEEIRSRIFEPFYTTKEAAGGSGLGLAVAHGIVTQSGGTIAVYSEWGIGTTFKIYLPREQPESAPEPSMIHESGDDPRGTETILLVEDEDGVRRLLRRTLEEVGYQVFEASSGEKALELAAAHSGTIQLLITDTVMPGMGGRALAEQLTAIDPRIKVIYISGYTDDAVVRHGVLHEVVNFLQKPFAPSTLAHKVREVLDS
jgi:PAS domain S-box-containing protein